jgi:hypothetical protein
VNSPGAADCQIQFSLVLVAVIASNAYLVRKQSYWMEEVMDLNLMVKPSAVAVAGVAGFVLGAVWYAPFLFGNQWMASLGKTREQLGKPIPAMGLTLVTCLVSAWVLAVIIMRAGVGSAPGGALVGLAAGMGIYAASLYSDSLFAGLSFRYVLIQAGYRVFQFGLMGAILGAWR